MLIRIPSRETTPFSGLDLLQPAQRAQLGARLLRDPVRAVRIEAARVLASARSLLKGDDRKALDNAISEFIEAQKAVSDVPEGHVGLALLYADLGSPQVAENEYKIALKIDPRHVASRVNLAEMIFQLGRVSEAGQLLEEGVKLVPNDGFIQEAIGRHYIRIQQYDLGLSHLAKAVELQPDRPELRYFLGVGYNSIGRFQDAMPHLKRAVELDPRNPEYLSGVFAICRDNQEFGQAIYYLDKLIQVQPDPQLQQVRQQLMQLKQQSGR